MNPDVKDKWLTALRSGDYRQAQSTLSVDNTFCCLGVLCDLAVKDGVIEEPEFIDGIAFYGHTGANIFLPREVFEWAGLPDSDPVVDAPGELRDKWGRPFRTSLSSLNDDFEYDFPRIADVIDSEL